MKNFKITLFSIAMALMVFVSCTNDEPVIEEQQTTEESQSITTALAQFRTNFDDNGNLDEFDNPAGNVVFDFCFDFVYPLTLSYNNGTTVTVDDLDALVDVMINSTNDLYIDGIAFPFDVETYNESTNAIEIVTINNEEEFANLIENCGFEVVDPCECFEVYEPVCVEITDPNGATFTMTYPNACYAECDGFTENDFVDTCEDDHYSGGSVCFTINYPLSIIVDNETITVNSEEELGNALYDAYNFDFVYPFTVTLDNDIEEVVTINSVEDIETLLEDCYGDINGNECEECVDAGDNPVCVEITDPNGNPYIATFPNMCYVICEGFTQADVVECVDNNPDECEECLNAPVDPVCIEYIDAQGNTIVTVFPNMCFAECEGFTQNNVVDCDDNNMPNDCSEDLIQTALVGCQFWTVTIGNLEYNYVFSSDGSVTVTQNNDTITSGTWSITTNNEGVVMVIITTDSGNFTNDWSFDCNPANGLAVTSSAAWITNIVPGCD